MYSVLKKLIEKKFYATKEEAIQKVDVFYACNKLTDEEYADLLTLIEEKYKEEPVPPNEEVEEVEDSESETESVEDETEKETEEIAENE